MHFKVASIRDIPVMPHLCRLHLDSQSIIKFEEFYAQFRESVSSEYPRWLDPVARLQTDRANMSASQVI